ncbi:Cytochrome c biogenesis CcmF C-terminal-like mitochondrial protein [Vigna angularis]|uniref:Cytochrome c biogenesis CcmF C-terminal-like mitochondrial protein n=1 Tax=Phaseolus angularis TaxID=3914 RepID=A0A8T0K8U6_PHAAN|nr:Cytochrome c biogenesis CcmF C-terminal-like mitochondrial protein [Vigna angularis]
MVVPRGTAAPLLLKWFVSRDVPTGAPFSNGTIIPILIPSFPLLVYLHSRKFIRSMDGAKSGVLVKASRPILLPDIIGRSSSETRAGNASFRFVPVLHFLLIESKGDFSYLESFYGVLCLLFFRTLFSLPRDRSAKREWAQRRKRKTLRPKPNGNEQKRNDKMGCSGHPHLERRVEGFWPVALPVPPSSGGACVGGVPPEPEIGLEALALQTSRQLMVVGQDYHQKAPMKMNISHFGVCICMLGVLLSCDPAAYVRPVAHASYLFRVGGVNFDLIWVFNPAVEMLRTLDELMRMGVSLAARKHQVLTTLRDTKAQISHPTKSLTREQENSHYRWKASQAVSAPTSWVAGGEERTWGLKPGRSITKRVIPFRARQKTGRTLDTIADLVRQYKLMLNMHDMKEQPGQSILNLYSLLSYVCFLEILLLMLTSFLTLALTDDCEPARAYLLHRSPLPTLYSAKPGNGIRDCLTRPPRKNTPKRSKTQFQPQTHSKAAATNEDSSDPSFDQSSPNPLLKLGQASSLILDWPLLEYWYKPLEEANQSKYLARKSLLPYSVYPGST